MDHTHRWVSRLPSETQACPKLFGSMLSACSAPAWKSLCLSSSDIVDDEDELFGVRVRIGIAVIG